MSKKKPTLVVAADSAREEIQTRIARNAEIVESKHKQDVKLAKTLTNLQAAGSAARTKRDEAHNMLNSEARRNEGVVQFLQLSLNSVGEPDGIDTLEDPPTGEDEAIETDPPDES